MYFADLDVDERTVLKWILTGYFGVGQIKLVQVRVQ
jgi:hypothetical protein